MSFSKNYAKRKDRISDILSFISISPRKEKGEMEFQVSIVSLCRKSIYIPHISIIEMDWDSFR